MAVWVDAIVNLDFLPEFSQTIVPPIASVLDNFDPLRRDEVRHIVKIFKSLAKAGAYHG